MVAGLADQLIMKNAMHRNIHQIGRNTNMVDGRTPPLKLHRAQIMTPISHTVRLDILSNQHTRLHIQALQHNAEIGVIMIAVVISRYKDRHSGEVAAQMHQLIMHVQNTGQLAVIHVIKIMQIHVNESTRAILLALIHCPVIRPAALLYKNVESTILPSASK